MGHVGQTVVPEASLLAPPIHRGKVQGSDVGRATGQGPNGLGSGRKFPTAVSHLLQVGAVYACQPQHPGVGGAGEGQQMVGGAGEGQQMVGGAGKGQQTMGGEGRGNGWWVGRGGAVYGGWGGEGQWMVGARSHLPLGDHDVTLSDVDASQTVPRRLEEHG